MEPDDERDENTCWRCGGSGVGIVGVDWDGPYDGELEGPAVVVRHDYEVDPGCDCCGGTGLADDCMYW